MTCSIFERWLHKLNKIQEERKEKIALIIDNASCHNRVGLDILSHIEIFRLPPNSTSIFQPLDKGIIRSFKSYYRTTFLKKYIKKCENNEDKKTNILEAIQDIHFSWGCVSKETMLNSSNHALKFDNSNQDTTIEICNADGEVGLLKKILDLDELFENFVEVDEMLIFESLDIESFVDDLKEDCSEEFLNDTQNDLKCKKSIKNSEIELAIQTLKNFIFQSNNSNIDLLDCISRVEVFFEKNRMKIQTCIEDFMVKKPSLDD